MSPRDRWLLCDPYCAQFKCYHEEETEMNEEPSVTEAELSRMAEESCPCGDPECSFNLASCIARELAAARAAIKVAREAGIREGWRSAITLASNVCVQRSDRHLADDENDEARTSNECAKAIQGFIEPDAGYMAEMLTQLNTHTHE